MPAVARARMSQVIPWDLYFPEGGRGIWPEKRRLRLIARRSEHIISSAVHAPLPALGADASTSVLAASEERIQFLALLYKFKDYSRVTGFLMESPFLTDLLFEAHERIEAYFGSDTEIALDVVVDPEAEDDRELFVLVQTGLPPNEALARLSSFDQEWWLHALPVASCKMTIDLEYC